MLFISPQMPLAQVCPKIYPSSKLHPGAKLKLHLKEQRWLLIFSSFKALRGNKVISSANRTQPTSMWVMRLTLNAVSNIVVCLWSSSLTGLFS